MKIGKYRRIYNDVCRIGVSDCRRFQLIYLWLLDEWVTGEKANDGRWERKRMNKNKCHDKEVLGRVTMREGVRDRIA